MAFEFRLKRPLSRESVVDLDDEAVLDALRARDAAAAKAPACCG